MVRNNKNKNIGTLAQVGNFSSWSPGTGYIEVLHTNTSTSTTIYDGHNHN